MTICIRLTLIGDLIGMPEVVLLGPKMFPRTRYTLTRRWQSKDATSTGGCEPLGDDSELYTIQ